MPFYEKKSKDFRHCPRFAPAAEPDPEPGPEPEPPAGEQEMMAVCLQCGIEVTHHQLQDTIREREGEPFRTFSFPRHANEDQGENFSEWLNPYEEPDDSAQQVAAMRSAAQATASPEHPLTGSESFETLRDLVQEKVYDGERSVLEPMLRSRWNLLGPSFQQLPNTARWTIQRVADHVTPALMPVLCDDNALHLLLPTSAKCIPRCGALTMPDPYHARDQAAGHEPYMCGDVWFEDCGDGGAYVLGLDDDRVLIFYVDGPGDMVYGRWQCSRSQWESMWLSAFGSLSVTVESEP